MKNKKIKIAILITLLSSMIFFIGFIFYMSEPNYIDNVGSNRQYKIHKYDVVSTANNNSINIGVVIQIDSVSFKDTRATVKNFEYAYSNDKYRIIHITPIATKDSTKDCFTIDYSIIGHGTFYHKVNSFVGFNIMMITVFIIVILLIIIARILILTIDELMGWDFF